MAALELKAYEILKSKVGEAEAATLMEYFESKAEEKYKLNKENIATKHDLSETKSELLRWMFLFWVGQLAAMFAFSKLI